MTGMTQQVRDYAAKLAEKERGMAETSEKFIASGGEVCLRKATKSASDPKRTFHAGGCV